MHLFATSKLAERGVKTQPGSGFQLKNRHKKRAGTLKSPGPFSFDWIIQPQLSTSCDLQATCRKVTAIVNLAPGAGGRRRSSMGEQEVQP